MSAKPRHVHAADLHGLGRLAVDATLGITGIVETMHHNISRIPGPLGKSTQKPTKGITGLVYRSIRGVTRLVGGGVDLALANLASLVGEEPSSRTREAVLAALNGVLGDHLATSGNPLAIPMRFRRGGQALVLRRPSLEKAIPRPTGRILVLIHGLCRSDLQWERDGHDHGAAIASDTAFEPSYTPVYLHYNSGLHVSTNGRELARLVESLVRAWPVAVEEIAILAHSMGGLIARSALHYAAESKRAWPGKVTKIVFLGTPHDGAPLERGGNWVTVVLDRSPYTTAFSRLGKLRSAGITDLRHGNLLDDDWMGRDRFAASGRVATKRRLVPLPEGVQCFAAAASLARKGGSLRERFLGDGLVQVPSALGHGRTPKGALGIAAKRQWIGYGMNHLDLLDRPEVCDRIRRWLA
jgi:pimeloyl-ACP methyl ester carboxylesterase